MNAGCNCSPGTIRTSRGSFPATTPAAAPTTFPAAASVAASATANNMTSNAPVQQSQPLPPPLLAPIGSTAPVQQSLPLPPPLLAPIGSTAPVQQSLPLPPPLLTPIGSKSVGVIGRGPPTKTSAPTSNPFYSGSGTGGRHGFRGPSLGSGLTVEVESEPRQAHLPMPPFIIFGPPGTGKYVFLILRSCLWGGASQLFLFQQYFSV